MAVHLSRRIRTAVEVWNFVEQSLLGILVSGMVILAAVQIILRNFFRGGILWADQILGISLLWLTMIGALVATGARKHINVDLVAHLFPRRGKEAVMIIVNAFAAVVCGLLTASAARFVGLQKEMDSSVVLNVPMWIYYLIVPICLALMSLRFVVHAAASLVHTVSRKKLEEGSAS